MSNKIIIVNNRDHNDKEFQIILVGHDDGYCFTIEAKTEEQLKKLHEMMGKVYE